ncbi:MAG: stage sporulation protein [Bacillota bacterium]|jgi:stage V sporulation protein G|nr:stage sporulation protein [Bacillota bacterium]MDK2881852.1 stage sporulation protein [Bacillota bacterium]MDK2960121.1 stage sporulation protein [Bacillota bacterium]
MEITDIRVRPVTGESKMKAYVSITLDGSFAVHDIRVVEGPKGLFVAMPSKKLPSGEFRDIVHPINAATRQMMQERILRAYAEATNGGA